jgi:hypothetical protein
VTTISSNSNLGGGNSYAKPIAEPIAQPKPVVRDEPEYIDEPEAAPFNQYKEGVRSGTRAVPECSI